MTVIEFLRSYQTHPSSFRVVPPMIADFIAGMNLDGELTRWTVALVGAEKGDPETIGDVTAGMLQRKAIGDPEERYSIKTLISPRDQAIDLSKAQYEAAVQRSRETWRGDADRNESRVPPDDPQGPAIRHILGFGHAGLGLLPDRTRGLLLLHLLDPAKSGCTAICGRRPALAWSLSFLGSASKRRIRDTDYMANSVLWGVLNDDLE
jgi:hypothetical protein